MRLIPTLLGIAVRHVLQGVLQKLGLQPGREAVGQVTKWLHQHFTDHSQRLTQAVINVQSQTWDALEIALAGESIWATITTPADRRAFHAQLRAFLGSMFLPESIKDRKVFFARCLADLQELRKDFACVKFDANELASDLGGLVRFGSQNELLEAETQQLAEVANQLQRTGFQYLPHLLTVDVSSHGVGSALGHAPLLVFTFNYFFRRAIEEDSKLFQGLTWEMLTRLEEEQQQNFGAVLVKLDQLLDQTRTKPAQTGKYQAEIKRANPTCLIFLVDQSASMTEPFGNEPDKQKAHEVANQINLFLHNLVLKCKRQDGIRSFCSIGVLGYSGSQVCSAFGDGLAEKPLVTPADLENHSRNEIREIREPDSKGGFIVKKRRCRVWLEPKADGQTPMRAALLKAKEILARFLAEHPDCFPPIVLNFTDGQPTENPTDAVHELCQLQSTDGNVLLFNAHVSKVQSVPIRFPFNSQALPANDPYAFLMFHLTSVVPEMMIRLVQNMVSPPRLGARGFVFNGDLNAVIQFLDMGTSAAISAKV